MGDGIRLNLAPSRLTINPIKSPLFVGESADPTNHSQGHVMKIFIEQWTITLNINLDLSSEVMWQTQGHETTNWEWFMGLSYTTYLC